MRQKKKKEENLHFGFSFSYFNIRIEVKRIRLTSFVPVCTYLSMYGHFFGGNSLNEPTEEKKNVEKREQIKDYDEAYP